MPDLDAIRQLIEDLGHETTMSLMAVFKGDVDKRIDAVRTWLEHGGEIKDLRLHAHSLKGLCRTYGAPEGGDLAMALQDACERGDAADIRAKAEAVLARIPADTAAAIEAARGLEQA